MKESEENDAFEKLVHLQSGYQIKINADWKYKDPKSGEWDAGSWSIDELDHLHTAIALLADVMGGSDKVVQNLGGVIVQKLDIGIQGGNAIAHHVNLNTKGSFSTWTVIHEFAHAWDANCGWRLSAALEKHTGGFTSRRLSLIYKILGYWDAGPHGSEEKPGRRGRKPGCNSAGYFYGDKPSGSNWKFNRKEDFAESVAMYIGWQGDNDLSGQAHGRIRRYELQNGERDKFFRIVDNWAD
ncbi:MAG: hypothetical protein MUO77_13250 [Anaerolineales bacterium]|nr:hypothetical protein [Anaerolineales bacterium]